MLRVGLNPYGIAYWVGLFAAGTPRANPNPLGLNGFLDLVEKLELAGVEIPVALLKNLSPEESHRAWERIHSNGKYAILMHGIPWGDLDGSLEVAKLFGFSVVRQHLTSVLCGARAELGDDWPRLFADARAKLREYARKAADAGIGVTVENHQDLTSSELIDICEECGPNVGVCLDTGNPLAVGEDPVEFARAVAPWVRHLHLKDYLVFKQVQGYRLVRCELGGGEIPFAEIVKVLAPNGALPASVEPGALEGRYVRLLNPKWWTHYPRRDAQSLALCMQRVWPRVKPEEIERSPWEAEAEPAKIVDYERAQFFRSVLYLFGAGLVNAQVIQNFKKLPNWEE
ncbi:MAG TPA: sugar phosphate isomerase/epimerase [Planctomycetota bacterium]|nr:sugar phosphate isomerase/epimerase [Planctomycetota bacterium]